jgi:protein SCO1/2
LIRVTKPVTKFRLAFAGVGMATLLAGVWLVATYREHDARAVLQPDAVLTVLPTPKPLSPFALVDHERRAFDETRLRGKWSLVFFGFTHCMDVCPTTLATLAHARQQIARSTRGADDVQIVFVSVDPGRDSIDKLKQYTRTFDPSVVGVTGADAKLRELTEQLGAAYEVAPAPGQENYPVVHSSAVYVLDPQARLHALFTPPLDAKTIGARFNVLRERAAAEAS